MKHNQNNDVLFVRTNNRPVVRVDCDLTTGQMEGTVYPTAKASSLNIENWSSTYVTRDKLNHVTSYRDVDGSKHLSFVTNEFDLNKAKEIVIREAKEELQSIGVALETCSKIGKNYEKIAMEM